MTNELNKSLSVYEALRSRDNIAESGFDYNPVRTVLTFVKGEGQEGEGQEGEGQELSQLQTVTVDIIKDDLAEPAEQLILMLRLEIYLFFYSDGMMKKFI